MPDLFRAHGFVFMFFSLEHAPIHVVGKDGDAKYEWDGERFILQQQHNIKSSDLRKIRTMIDDNADIIVSRWNQYFKEVKNED